jgi:hypothetical protein
MKAIRVGSSDVPKMRHEQMEAHKRFQQMLADGWQVQNVKKARRPRIAKPRTPKQVRVKVFDRSVVIDYKDYLDRYQGFTVLVEIY